MKLSNPPQSLDTLLFLIAQELKIRRVFNALRDAGIDDCPFEPYLDRLILAELGLDEGNDEVLNRYCKIIGKRSRKIGPEHESIMKQSLKAYLELINQH
jgi:hypothetical protein